MLNTNIILLVGIGYLLGSIPFSYLVSKWMGKIDIREYGSGNTGATNVIRTLGKKAGAVAFLGDFSKGLVAALVGHAVMGQDGAVISGAFAVIGHCYPFTLGFKGGKGVAATAGMIVGTNPLLALILIVFQFAVIRLSGYMSLGSILSAAAFPVFSYMLGASMQFVLWAVFLGVFVIYRHRSNLDRLIKGTESKFTFSSQPKVKNPKK
jgi:glycerol-3-phosphate acyltransferase PlsY